MERSMFGKIIKTVIIAGFFVGGFFIFSEIVWGKILISEVLTGLNSTTNEYVELYNSGSTTINLQDWGLRKLTNTGTESSLFSSFTATSTINPFGYFLISHHDYQPIAGVASDKSYKSGSLADTNNAVLLFDSQKNLVDWLFWGTVSSSNYSSLVGQAINKITDDKSMCRRPNDDSGNGQDTGNNNTDFLEITPDPRNSLSQARPISTSSVTTSPIMATTTPTSTNNITSSTITTTTITSTSSSNNSSFTSSTPITSSTQQFSAGTIEKWKDIKINEFVSDPESGNEWVELFNNSTSSFNLAGGSICDNKETSCKVTTGTILGKDWLIIDLNSKSYLNNDGDSIILLDTDDGEADKIIYGTDLKSPSKGQSLARKIDGVDTDSNNDWAITTQVTKQTTNVIVALAPQASGGGGSAHKQLNNETMEQSKTTSSTTSTSITPSSTYTPPTPQTIGNVILSEIYPNPIGPDTLDEYIRVTNLSGDVINLFGWKLADLAKSYKLSGIINSGQAIIYKRASTTIALNNTTVEVVSLIDHNGKLIDKVGYNKAEEGMVYRRYGEEWKWEELDPVLGIGGSLVDLIDESVDESEKLNSKIVNSKSVENKKVDSNPTKNSKIVFSLTLGQAREAEKGELVKVSGIVSALPNVFGSQYFYITDGRNGVQIYNYKKEFIHLALGDKVEVIGEISNAYGINRVKTINKTDVDILATQQFLNITSSTISELGENNLGGLVKISGLITEIKGSFMYVDDGDNEMPVYFKSGTGIDKKLFKEGESVAVVGILAEGTDGWQLWPRSQSDIKLLNNSQYLLQQNLVLKSDSNTSKETTSKYLTTTIGGLGAIIFGFIARARGAFAFGLIKKAAMMATRIIRRG